MNESELRDQIAMWEMLARGAISEQSARAYMLEVEHAKAQIDWLRLRDTIKPN